MASSHVVRPAVPGDYEHFLAFLPELGLPGDPTPDSAKWEDEWLPHTSFLEIDGVVAGYAALRVLTGTGHVLHLVTAPSHRRRGVGMALMDHMAGVLRAAGCSCWALNVKDDNEAAIRLYERCGMRIAHRAVSMAIAWAGVDRLPREEGESVEARSVDASEDAAIEEAFGILSGRLAALRASPGRVLLRLADTRIPDATGVGFACFDPAFPGASPFRVARPALARALLEAIRPHARSSDAGLRVAVEGDEALAAALAAVGAETKLSLFHMTGDVPRASG